MNPIHGEENNHFISNTTVHVLFFFYFLFFWGGGVGGDSLSRSNVHHETGKQNVAQRELRQFSYNYLINLSLDLFLFFFHAFHKCISKLKTFHAVVSLVGLSVFQRSGRLHRLCPSVFGFAPEELIMLLFLHNSKHCMLMEKTGVTACWSSVWVFSFVLTACHFPPKPN